MASTEETLKERGERYGKFTGHAEITQKLKATMLQGVHMHPETTERVKSRVAKMQHDQIECLEMIAHKIGRILNGDPNYGDSWRDIAGYATLVADRLEGVTKSQDSQESVKALQERLLAAYGKWSNSLLSTQDFIKVRDEIKRKILGF